MKTPGQRQLIALQERVKVGAISVDEAVQEFKAWQFDHERRANSLRYQQVELICDPSVAELWSGIGCSVCSCVAFVFPQENLRKLRESITRRHKIREKSGKGLGRIVLSLHYL